jgi:hypothetical protein
MLTLSESGVIHGQLGSFTTYLQYNVIDHLKLYVFLSLTRIYEANFGMPFLVKP